jgi:hypothetical protein
MSLQNPLQKNIKPINAALVVQFPVPLVKVEISSTAVIGYSSIQPSTSMVSACLAAHPSVSVSNRLWNFTRD